MTAFTLTSITGEPRSDAASGSSCAAEESAAEEGAAPKSRLLAALWRVAGSPRRGPGFWGHAARVARSEFENVHPAQWLAQGVSRALPNLAFSRTRTAVLRAAGMKIGPRSLVFGSISVSRRDDANELFSIGADSMITGSLFVDLGAEVRIGDRVHIGHHVVLETVDHEINPTTRRCGAWKAAPIFVDDGAWLGCRVLILPGVRIGKGAVVAAGAVVTRDVPPDTLVAGVPARVVRDLDEPVASQQWPTRAAHGLESERIARDLSARG